MLDVIPPRKLLEVGRTHYLGSSREIMGLEREPEDDVVDERIAASLVTWYGVRIESRDCCC